MISQLQRVQRRTDSVQQRLSLERFVEKRERTLAQCNLARLVVPMRGYENDGNGRFHLTQEGLQFQAAQS